MPKRSFFPEDPVKPMSVRNRMYLRYTYKSDSEDYESSEEEAESRERVESIEEGEFRPKVPKEKTGSNVGGKWMLFLDKSVIPIERGMTHLDYAWQFMKSLVDDFKNTGIAELASSTAYSGWYPADPNSNEGVICCFTEDYRDKRDVKRAADAIRKVFHYPKNLLYKTNDATTAQVYACFGHKHISIYKHTLENEMYERDLNNLWSSVMCENAILL